MKGTKSSLSAGASLLLVMGCLLGSSCVQAQTVKNIKATVVDGKVEVRYDLIAPDKNYEFAVELFASFNNYGTALRQVTGDVGERVYAGEGKRIIWMPKGELMNYKGELQFEVRARAAVVVAPIRFIAPSGGARVKAGGSLQIQWEGGDLKEQLKLFLVQGDKQIADLGAFSNTGATKQDFDKKLTPGSYQLKLIGYEGAVFSNAFTVKKKPSPLYKILPVAVLLGAGAAVLGGGSSGDGGEKVLPVAPEPN